MNGGVRVLVSETTFVRVIVEEYSLSSHVNVDLVENWLEVSSDISLVSCDSVWSVVVVVVFVYSLKAYCF